jgi:acetyl-CoA acetyltransferase
MTRDVVVLGVGMHPFGRWPDKATSQLVYEAATAALQMANVPYGDVNLVCVGRVQPSSGGGFENVTELGMTGIPIITTDMACASSSTALRQGAQAIELGIADVALIVGFERMERGLVQANTPGNYKEKLGMGMMPPRYALKATAYMDRYETPVEAFAQVSVKSHRNSVHNPYAHHRKELTLEEVLNSRMIAEPITLYQCCPTSDGAAAAVICARDVAARYSSRWIRIAGWGMGTPSFDDSQSLETDADLTDEVARRIAKEAYARAGIGPDDIGVTQLHDAFAPGEIIRIEALGLCEEGTAGELTMRGETEITGRIPVNTDGGLLSRGHPLGATGIAQVAEVYSQMLGIAGPRQIAKPPRVGVCHNAGGGASAGIVVHVFDR